MQSGPSDRFQTRTEFATARSELPVIRGKLSELRTDLSQTRSDLPQMRAKFSESRPKSSEMRAKFSETSSESSQIDTEWSEMQGGSSPESTEFPVQCPDWVQQGCSEIGAKLWGRGVTGERLRLTVISLDIGRQQNATASLDEGLEQLQRRWELPACSSLRKSQLIGRKDVGPSRVQRGLRSYDPAPRARGHAVLYLAVDAQLFIRERPVQAADRRLKTSPKELWFARQEH